MRKRLFEIIEKSDGDFASSLYDYLMMICIISSLLPLAFKQSNAAFEIIEKITATVFIIDYFFRIITADFKLEKGTISFLLYPFTFMALVDIVCILPTFLAVSSGLRLLKVFRLMRTFKVFRTAKFLRYSKSIEIVVDVIKEQKSPLIAVCILSAAYILISALVIFNIEPDTFSSFFSAIYWATVSLTTVGYGDIYPTSTAGQIITMISALLGIAIIALPSGIITAGYMEKIKATNNEIKDDNTNKE